VETDRDVEDFLENHLEGVCFAEFEDFVARSTLFSMGFLAPLDLAPQIVDGLRVYISAVIVASMRFSNSGCRHPRVLKPHKEGEI
jgi:hypothetical protein